MNEEVWESPERREIKGHPVLKVQEAYPSEDHQEMQVNVDPQDQKDHEVKITSHEVMRLQK